MGRGLRACCFAAPPNATLSFKEATDTVQQPEAHSLTSSESCLGDVLGLLPAEGPQKEGVAPRGASKAASFHECTGECIPAGTYIAAAAAPAEQPEAASAQDGSHVAEEPPADAAPSAEWERSQPPSFQGGDWSLEAAVAAALGLPAPTANTASTEQARPTARSIRAAHLSLELQVAEALGDLHPAASAAAHGATGTEAGLARCGSGGGSTTSLSSPWRTSTSSFAAEAEASKRFSCCGSACPVLETIRESISTQEQSYSSLPPSDPSYVSGAGGSTAAACAVPVASSGQVADGSAEADEIGSEVAALLGCTPSGPAPASPGTATQHPLADILVLLGQQGGSSSQAETAGTPRATSEGFDAAIEQLLHAARIEAQATATAAADAAIQPAPAAAIMAGRLASFSQASWDAESPPPAASPPSSEAAAAVPAPPADGGIDSQAGNDGSGPVEEPSSDSVPSSGASATAGHVVTTGSTFPDAARALFATSFPVAPDARGPPSWSSDGGEGADPLAAMHDRALRQRREAEQRYAQLRQQQEAQELGTCTFRPKLSGGRSPSRPGSAASLGLASGGGSSCFGEAAGSAMYARQQAQRQRQLERLAAQRAEQERDALAPCTFHPAVDARSQRMFASGVRYGGSRVVAGGPSVDEAVHRQLRLLHSAGLNAAAAAAVLASQGLASADDEPAEPATSGPPAQPDVAYGFATGQPLPAQLGDVSDAAIPLVLQQAAPFPTRRQLSAASGMATALLSPAVAGRPLSASARLYAHAVDLQGRQRQAAALWEQKQRAELLAASPKAKPFPRAQHTHPPSPPLSRRSPPISRPGSAPPPRMLCASLEQAATELTATGLDMPDPSPGRVLGRSTTAKAASYWQRWGLEPGADFDGFLQRQEKFVQALGAKLDAERQLPASQAAAAEPGAHLSPGSRRLLERRRQRELAREMEAAGCMRAGMAGCGGNADHSGRSSPDSTGVNGTAGSLGSKASPQEASAASGPFSFRPAITARAAAKPARTPEELHAEAARRQEKLAQRRREAEQASLAPCTFAPDIAPAAGSPLSAKFARMARGRIDLQDLGRYMREVRQKQAAREEAAAAAARARQEEELSHCTFQPNLGRGCTPRSPAKQSGSGGAATAWGTEPAASPGMSGGLAVKAARPPDVLAQVQALLCGGSASEAAADDDCAATSDAAAVRWKRQ